MKAGRIVIALVIALASVSLVPVRAAATDADLKHAFAFRVEASAGYSIVAFATNERADGRGELVLFVHRGDEGAIYVAPARLTATSLEADLGSLGRVSLGVAPSGRERTVRSPCGGDPETTTFEPLSYRGTFEFHGEEGYTEASTTSPREYVRFFAYLVCSGGLRGESSGPGLPGARLLVPQGRGHHRSSLRVNKNRPRARSRFEVEVHEKRRGIEISRSTTLWAGAGAFDYDPLLRTATLDPPPPFSGRATFRRGAAPANRWTGDLTVDLPGRSDVPMTGSGARPTLIPSCWQGEGAGSRADCGF